MAITATIPNRSIPIGTISVSGIRYDMPLNDEWARFLRDIQVRSGGVAGVIAANSGGTGFSSYTVGDILYADTTTSLSRLNAVASGSALISAGAATAPAWGKIGLTTHVVGTLPQANGGTGFTAFSPDMEDWLQDATSAKLAATMTDETGFGPLVFANTPTLIAPILGTPTSGNLSNCTGYPSASLSGTITVAQGGTGMTSGTSGGVPYYSSSSTIASSAQLTANAITLGGGAGGAPVSLGSLGTATTVLHGNAGGAPTFGAVSLVADVSGVLPAANGGTGQASYTIGDLLYASGATTLSKLAGVATGNALISGGVGTAFSWGKIDLTAHVTGTLPVSNGGTGVTALSSLTANPSASVGLSAVNGSASTFMRSDGAPALSQSIAPTWTATHTFSKSGGGTSAATLLSSAAPATAWNETDAAADNKLWDLLANGEQLLGRVVNDANSAASNWIAVDRTGTTVDSVTLAGQVISSTSGKGLSVKEGSNCKQGTATLVAGSSVVSNTSVTANSRIFLTSQADGGTPGWLRVSARTAGTSFTITSSSATDTSTVAYEIFEPS